MTNNLNPGVYVVLSGGETEHWVPDQMNDAAKQLGYSLAQLVAFFQSQWSFLSQEEATVLAAAVVYSFPVHLQDNPELLLGLSQLAADIKASRHEA